MNDEQRIKKNNDRLAKVIAQKKAEKAAALEKLKAKEAVKKNKKKKK